MIMNFLLQAFASGITGTLAAHAVLQGVGVGDESATVLAATITWLLKSRSPGLILGLRPSNERRRYIVTPSLIGWAQA